MDWFLYDIGLRHERVKDNRKSEKNVEISNRHLHATNIYATFL